jgi:hypothetical protein
MRPLVLSLALLVAPVAGTRAQDGATASRWTTPDSAALSLLQGRIQGKKRVRIFANAAPVELLHPTADASGLRAADAPAVPWETVSRVQVRTSAFPRGLVYGSVIGGSVGLMVGLESLRECEGGLDLVCGADAGTVLGITAISAVAGAFWGGLIAAPFGRWSTVYQAQAAPRTPPVALIPTRDGGVAVVSRIQF